MMPRNKGNVDEVERIHINVSSSSDSDSELDISFRTRCNKLKELLSQKPPERVRLKDLAKDRRKSFLFRKSLVHAAVCEFVENQEQQQTPVDENKNCNVKNLSANTRRRRFLTNSTPQVSNNIARFSSGDVSSINETDSENSKKDAAKEEGRSVHISDKNQTKHTPEITSINNSTDSCIKRLEASANINRTRRRRDKENSTNVTRQTDEVPARKKSKDNKAGDLQESNKNINIVIPESDEDFDWPISISGMQKISRNVTDTEDPESSDSSTGSNAALCHTMFLYESLERGAMEIPSPKPWRCDFSNSNARESLSLGFTNISANPIEERRTYTRLRKKCVYGRSKNSESTKESKLLNIISRLSLMKESSFIESSDEDNCPPKTKNDVQNNNSRSRTVGNISQQKDQTPGQRDSPQGSSTYNKSATTPQLFVLLNKSTNKKKVVSSRTPHRDKSSNRRSRDKENSTNVTRQTDEVPAREKSKDNKAGDLQESNKNISGRSLRSRGKNIVEAVVEKLQESTNVMCSKSGKVVNNNETLKRSVFTTPKGLRRFVLNNNHRRSRSLNVEKVCEVIPESDEDFDRPISISGMQKISRNVTDTKDPESSDSSTGSNTALCHTNFLYESLERGAMEIPSPKPWRCDFSNSNARESLSLGFTNISANPIEERRTYTRGRKKCVYGRSKNSESTKESKLLNIISRLSLKKESSFIESSDEDNCPPKTKNDVQNNNSRSRTVGNISQQKDQTPGQRDSPQGSSTYNKSATTPQLFVLLNKSTNKKKVVSSRTPHRDKSSNKNDDVSNHRNSSRTPLRSTLKDEGSRMSLRSPHKGNHSTRIASRSRSPHKENCSRSPPPNTPKKSLEPPHKENSSPRTASRSPQQKKDSSSKRLKTVGKNLCNIPVKAETSTSNHELPNSDTCVSDVIENIPPVIEYLELQLSPRSDKTTQKNITMDKNTTTEKHNKDIVKDQSKESNSSRGKRLQEIDDSIKMPPPKTIPKPRSRKVQVNANTEEDSVTSSTNSGEINEPPQVRRSGRISRPPRHMHEFEEVWLIKNAKQRNKMTKCTGVTHDTHGFVRIKPNSEKLTDLHQKHDLIILALSGNGEVIVNNEVSKIFSDKRSTFEVPTGMRYLIKNTSHEDDLELFYVTRLTRY